MNIRAAILEAPGRDLVLRSLQLAAPGPGEVRVRIHASGVCHSDLSVQIGAVVLPTPMVLGHEGAGVVEAIGPGVSTIEPGDHVVLSFAPRCGRCFYCCRGESHLCERGQARFRGGLLDGTTRLSHNGEPVFQMAMLGTFAEAVVVPAMSVVAVARDLPLGVAALIGCCVLTGVGSALNTATIIAGDTVAVIGCGAVGLNAIQGARLAGAGHVIGVDTVADKLDIARRFGATMVIDASAVAPIDAVRDLTGGRGADVVFETAGTASTIGAAVQMSRKGGQVILVGLPALDGLPSILEHLYYSARIVKACSYGSVDVLRDVPRFVELYRCGRLKIDELITERIQLEDVNDALADLSASTRAVRRVITFDSAE
ncbi:MAG: Zn-dependent alcohol dehydrogenase [Acidimicrobiales bacterium]